MKYLLFRHVNAINRRYRVCSTLELVLYISFIFSILIFSISGLLNGELIFIECMFVLVLILYVFLFHRSQVFRQKALLRHIEANNVEVRRCTCNKVTKLDITRYNKNILETRGILIDTLLSKCKCSLKSVKRRISDIDLAYTTCFLLEVDNEALLLDFSVFTSRLIYSEFEQLIVYYIVEGSLIRVLSVE